MKMGLGATKEASLAELAWVELIAWQGAGLGWNLCADVSNFAKKSMRFGEMKKFPGKDGKKPWNDRKNL